MTTDDTGTADSTGTHPAAAHPTNAHHTADVAFAERTERYRHELRVHCYRMLGSYTDAEDLVQETLLRAWRRRSDLTDGDHLRAWLYKIATNACLDHIKATHRRVPSLSSFRDVPWLEPYPDRLLDQAGPASRGPAARAVERETIQLTFLAIMQLLPPRQRAVIILRDVLDWPVADVAEQLDLSVAAVNSALQRGRATLRSQRPTAARDTWASATASLTSRDERAVLDAYIAAYEAGDDDTTFALVADDIRVTMPPAAACYLQDPDTGEYRAFKIDVLQVVDGLITEITTFGARLFPAFDLPEVLS